MNELLKPAIIRTVVPMLMGWILTMLADRFGIIPSEQQTAEWTSAITVLVGAAYYVLIRVGSQKFPWLEQLLGASSKPNYYRRTW